MAELGAKNRLAGTKNCQEGTRKGQIGAQNGQKIAMFGPNLAELGPKIAHDALPNLLKNKTRPPSNDALHGSQVVLAMPQK